MDQQAARDTIAAYLAGRHKSRSELEEARKALGQDPDFTRFIWRQLGRRAESPVYCDAFRENIAEFIDLGTEERAQAFPELEEHLRCCSKCAGEYLDLAPHWTACVVTEVGRRVRTLAEALRLCVVGGGKLITSRSGFVSVRCVPVGALLDAGEAGVTEGRRWSMKDDEAQVEFTITARSASVHAVELVLDVRFHGDMPVSDDDVFVRVRDLAGGTQHSASLAVANVITVPLDSCLLTLEMRIEGSKWTWEIPMELEHHE